MFRLVWVSAVLALAVVAALGVRWVLADFLLDQFGSLPSIPLRGGGSRSCLVSGPLRLPHGRADPEHRRRGVHPV